jgi:hypothetical protein
LKEDKMDKPHKTKKIREKYSETCIPIFSKSFPFNKKRISVEIKAMELKIKPNASKCNIPFVSTLKKGYPKNSRRFAASIIIMPAIAQYFGVVLFLKNTPPNIITTPQSALKIIAFII